MTVGQSYSKQRKSRLFDRHIGRPEDSLAVPVRHHMERLGDLVDPAIDPCDRIVDFGFAGNAARLADQEASSMPVQLLGERGRDVLLGFQGCPFLGVVIKIRQRVRPWSVEWAKAAYRLPGQSRTVVLQVAGEAGNFTQRNHDV